MKRNEILGEHKKGVRAVKYNAKPKAHITPVKPNNPVAKNANAAIGGGAAGAHKDAKKASQAVRGQKHKNAELAEVSLKGFGDYAKKAQMDRAMSQMGSAFAASPEDREKNLAKAAKREKGLAMHKTRVDKYWAEKNAKDKADREQAIRDKYAGVDIDAEIEKLQPALKAAYHEYQYGARNTYKQGEEEYHRIGAKIQELERAKKVLGDMDEATGDALGTISATTPDGKVSIKTTSGDEIKTDQSALMPGANGTVQMKPDAAGDTLKPGAKVVSTEDTAEEDMLAPRPDSSSPIHGDDDHKHIVILKKLAGLR